MGRRLAVIKFGGSFITNKSKLFTARPSNIRQAAEQIASVYHTETNVDLLVGAGTGSFAHFTARQYGLDKGAYTDEQLHAMSVTHNNVRRLSVMFTEALLAKKVPGFAVSPAGIMTCKDGALDHIGIQPLRILLDKRCVPVLHGDTACDSVRGTTIVSTETALNACLHELRAAYSHVTVIYAMSGDGVLDADGRLIPELSPDHEVTIRESAAHDVTGGIMGKINSARQALTMADNVYIVNGGQHGALQTALAGGVVGTKIVR